MLKASEKLSIRHWKIHDIKLKLAEARELLQTATISITPQRYRRLFRKASKTNRQLFSLLDLLGFFDFHVTNNGFGAYEHQISLFLKNTRGGWFSYYQGDFFVAKGELDCHHLDSEPTNNDPSNLVYISPVENLILANICKLAYYGKVQVQATLKQLRLCARFRYIEAQTKRLTFDRLAKQSFTTFSAS